MKRTLLLSAIAAIAFASCKKNDSYSTGGGPSGGTQAEMSYQLMAVNTSSTVAQKTTAGNLIWAAGFANPQLIKFEAKQNNTEIEYKSTNNAQVDLMAPVAITFGGFTIPNGVYDEIELRIHLDKQGAGPALQLDGQFDNGAVVIPVRLIVDEEIEIKTEMKNVTITDNTPMIAVTTIDLSTAMFDIRESMILSGTLTNGVLIVSRSSNRSIYNVVVNNLRSRKHHCEFKHKKGHK